MAETVPEKFISHVNMSLSNINTTDGNANTMNQYELAIDVEVELMIYYKK